MLSVFVSIFSCRFVVAFSNFPVKILGRIRKSASLKSASGHFVEEDIVELRQPETAREKGYSKLPEDHEVDPKADDFINKFKHQLKLQSGGMPGYISLCAGDPCPPIFKSHVQGLEDIMNNQVVCAIYRLPDAHKHITRPPPGVIFPKKVA